MRRIGRFQLCALRVAVILVIMTLAACGSQGQGPFGEPPLGEIGFVGSGGNGHFDGGYPRGDAGTGVADGGTGKDGGPGHHETDGGSPDDSGVENGGPGDGGSSVGIVLDLPPGFFAALDWVIEGPAGAYSGTVHFGGARSIEFVVGGIQAGNGYTITLSGIDAYGQPCSGTSAQFTVSPGATTGAGVILKCAAGDGATAATVSSGNVAIEAGVGIN